MDGLDVLAGLAGGPAATGIAAGVFVDFDGIAAEAFGATAVLAVADDDAVEPVEWSVRRRTSTR